MADYTLQEAAERLEVHYMTMYRYVRLGLIPATKARGSWRVTETDLDGFARPRAGRPTGTNAPWADRLQARMLAGDVTGSWAVLQAAMASGAHPEQVYAQIITPALTGIGRMWERGDIGIEDEHVASAVVGRLIGKLGPRFVRRGRSRGVVLATTPPGERHGFGVTMISDVMRGRGFEVLELGPDLPLDSLLATLRKVPDLKALCLSVVSTDHLAACARVVAAVKEQFPPVVVLVGGAAFSSEEHAAAVGGDGFAPDVVGAAEVLVDLVTARGKRPVVTP